MKTTVLSFSLAAVLAAGSLPAFAQNAAVVNGKPIPSAKLDKLIAGTGQPSSPELRDRARTMLIDRELLLQEANKRGITQRDDVQEQLEQARLNGLEDRCRLGAHLALDDAGIRVGATVRLEDSGLDGERTEEGQDTKARNGMRHVDLP